MLSDEFFVGLNGVAVFGTLRVAIGAEERVMVYAGPPQVFTALWTRQVKGHHAVLGLPMFAFKMYQKPFSFKGNLDDIPPWEETGANSVTENCQPA